MNGHSRMRIAVATAVGICLLGSSTLMAAVTNDRVYRFGEDDLEGPSQGAIIGSNNTGGAAADTTLDSEGPTRAFLDLDQTGDPTYQQVGPTGLNRPGVTGSEFGVRFDGDNDRLTGIALNRPDEMAGPTPVGIGPLVSNYPFNYDTITARGLQMWVYPDAAALGTPEAPTTFQSIVSDTTLSGGPAINENGQWTQINSGHTDVGQAPATVSVPAGDTWYHVMHHNYPISGDNFLSVVYVDGIAVSANNDTIAPGSTDALVVGATDGGDQTIDSFFTGVIDDLDMYVFGDNTSEGGQNYGTFDLFADNEWIANEIATTLPAGTLGPGDVNMDGVVNGDGTGAVDSDDVSAFIAGWRMEKELPGAHVDSTAGDWETWGWGDMDHSGVTDFSDWYILRANHPTPASLDLASLLSSAAVPEPTSSVLALFALLAWLGCGRRR